jgi:hypothetical protein
MGDPRVCTIPFRGDLEAMHNLDGSACFEKEEIEYLERFRGALNSVAIPRRRGELGRDLLRSMWPSEIDYIQKTHWIKTRVPGRISQLRLNYAQRRFYKDVIQRCREEGRPIRAIVLKGRQLGYSTFIQAWQFEQSDREAYRSSMTISYDDPSTEEMLRKAKFIYAKQWFPRDLDRDRKDSIQFAEPHGSTFFSETAGNDAAGRSLTIHHLHASEVPMWPNDSEVLGAVQQCVPIANDTSIFLESTAKGASGEFYGTWQKAVRGENDFIPFFAPWFWDPSYAYKFRTDDHRAEFARSITPLERSLRERFTLSIEQIAWRRMKIRNDLQGSEAKFRQEFPSYPDEAFLTTGSPVFNAHMVAELATNAKPPGWRGDIIMLAQPA